MNALLFGLIMAVIALVLLVAFLADQIIRLMGDVADENRAEDKADHAKCIAHVADVTSKRIVAVALRDLADRYDTARERTVIERIKREQWTPEGEPLPVLWLRHHADEVDPQ